MSRVSRTARSRGRSDGLRRPAVLAYPSSIESVNDLHRGRSIVRFGWFCNPLIGSGIRTSGWIRTSKARFRHSCVGFEPCYRTHLRTSNNLDNDDFQMSRHVTCSGPARR